MGFAGFSVSGLGLWGSGFWVQGFEVWVMGLESLGVCCLMVQGLGHGVQGC